MAKITKADEAVIEIIRNATIDEEGMTLNGQLDRSEYVAVNKFLDLAGAKWNRGKKRHLFTTPAAREKIESLLNEGGLIDEKKELQAFYTPKELAEELVMIADIGEGMEVLEPSAGEGAIALAARKAGGNVSCVEINPVAAKVLADKGFNPQIGDFLEFITALTFDRVVMNPPFTKDQDIAHILHAYEYLKEGGKLVAIMSPGFQYGTTKKREAFRNFVKEKGRVVKEVPAGAFKASGTMVSTVILELVRN